MNDTTRDYILVTAIISFTTMLVLVFGDTPKQIAEYLSFGTIAAKAFWPSPQEHVSRTGVSGPT